MMPLLTVLESHCYISRLAAFLTCVIVSPSLYPFLIQLDSALAKYHIIILLPIHSPIHWDVHSSACRLGIIIFNLWLNCEGHWNCHRLSPKPCSGLFLWKALRTSTLALPAPYLVLLVQFCTLKPVETLYHTFPSEWISVKVMSVQSIQIGFKIWLF